MELELEIGRERKSRKLLGIQKVDFLFWHQVTLVKQYGISPTKRALQLIIWLCQGRLMKASSSGMYLKVHSFSSKAVSTKCILQTG